MILHIPLHDALHNKRGSLYNRSRLVEFCGLGLFEGGRQRSAAAALPRSAVEEHPCSVRPQRQENEPERHDGGLQGEEPHM